MLSLFSTKSEEAGFRLQYMEVYNWGTFDKEVYRVNPQGNNSLLTGANGSGKTTYIDALLTLLVPAKKDRFYNQSSGAEKKGDRNEESYLLGYYGNIQEEGKLSSTTQMLRSKSDYSVLLATFSNEDQKTITLFQVRWISNGSLKRSFGIAHDKLTIEKDFASFDAKGVWKRKLIKTYNNTLKNKIVFYHGPTDYGERMAGLFGMRSTKALSLFNQVVGIKLLGDLDEFIRLNMLEGRDSLGEYELLKDSFVTLMSAKNDIDKTKEQIKQLSPINEIADRLKHTKDELKRLQKEKEYAVYWFANKGVEVSKNQVKINDAKLTICEEEIKKLEKVKTNLEEEKTNLDVLIKNDEVGLQIKELERIIEAHTIDRDLRREKLKHYNELANDLKLEENPNLDIFGKNRDLAEIEKKSCHSKEKDIQEQKRITINEEGELKKKNEEAVETLKVLDKNKNNISNQTARIRDEILTITGASKEEIPFIGELIKVNEIEKEWEGSIEKVLHNFALQIIVPEKYYSKVNEYVNNTNLKGLISYQRFKMSDSLKGMRYDEENTLLSKVSFKPENEYSNWVEDEIYSRFNFVCSNNLEDFRIEEKAITKQGLVKFGKGRHRKDDRRKTVSRENFVLGWNNKEKVLLWKEELKHIQERQKEVLSKLGKIEKALSSIKKREEKYNDLIKLFVKYDDINWLDHANQIKVNNDKKVALVESNDKVKILQDQLQKVKDDLFKIDGKGGALKLENEKRYNINRDNESVNKKITQCQRIIDSLSPPEESRISLDEVHSELKNLSFFDFEGIQTKFQSNNQVLIKESEIENSKLVNSLVMKIGAFKNPSEKITNQFSGWRSDVVA